MTTSVSVVSLQADDGAAAADAGAHGAGATVVQLRYSQKRAHVSWSLYRKIGFFNHQSALTDLSAET